MGLGIGNTNGGDGEFLPLLAYNAKAGRLKLTQRVEGPNGWEAQEQDVSFTQPTFLMDFATVQVGWLLFRKGTAPIKALVPIGQPLPACPRGDYGVDDKGKAITPKQGFVMRVMDAQGIVREFSSNALTVLPAVDALHTAYEASPEGKAGKLPVVQFQGADEVKSKHGSNFSPKFAIVRWADRPAALGPVKPIQQHAVTYPPEPAAAPVAANGMAPSMTADMAEPLPF